MFIQIYNASSFFIPKAASVLSMDISSQGLTVDCNGTVVEMGYLFVQALTIVRFWRSSDFRMVNYLRRCSESPAVTVLVFVSLSDC